MWVYFFLNGIPIHQPRGTTWGFERILTESGRPRYRSQLNYEISWTIPQDDLEGQLHFVGSLMLKDGMRIVVDDIEKEAKASCAG